MSISYNHYDEISLSSLKKDLRNYSWETFRQDALAGLTVAFFTVPQAMAYSLVAGLPLFCGLFAAIFSSLIAAIFGSSRQLMVGPSNAIAILVQTATSEILFTFYRGITGAERDALAVQILTQLVLMVGTFQIVAAVGKLGRLTQFVSHTVVIGYIAGSALAVIVGQLYTFLGLTPLQGVSSLYQRALYILSHPNSIHLPTALIGLGSIVMLIAIKKTSRKLPSAVIVLATAGVAVHLLGLSTYTKTEHFDPYENERMGHVSLVGDAGELFGIFPSVALPSFDITILNHMIPFAFAIALLSILETTSVAKSLAANSGQRLNVNQEIFGLSLGNLLASFIGAMPSSGSPSRSTLNYSNGAKTRFASIYSAFFVLLILFLFGFFVTRIPLTALAALLLVNAVSIVSVKQFLLCLKATRSDAFVLISTLFSCIFFSLHIAFYIGVMLSIILYLKKASVPHLVECTFDDTGKLENIDHTKKRDESKIRMINVQGELFFGAADLFQTTLKTLTEDDHTTKVIILRLKNARDIDATACLALHQLYDSLKNSKRYLIACGLTEQSWEVLCDSGLVEILGKENLFTFDEHHPNVTVQKAIARARSIIKHEEYTTAENPVPVPVPVPEKRN